MTYTENKSNLNSIHIYSKKFSLISLFCFILLLNIISISALEEQIDTTNTIYEKIHQTVKFDDTVDKEELEKRKKVKACDLLIKVRLAQDVVLKIFFIL